MFLTNSSGIYQPYVSWKGQSSHAAIAGWSRPLTTTDYNAVQQAPSGRPNPIKHWRKQLHPNTSSGTGRSAIGMPMDIPGGSVYLGQGGNCSCDTNGESEVVNITTNNVFNNSGKAVGPNGSTVCLACNPENNIIRSGMTEKLINPPNAQTQPTKKFSFSTKAYLKSKCMSYEQRLVGSQLQGVNYMDTYNDDTVGPQTRGALACPAETCNGKRINIIYKPSNRQFLTQGAVNSSSRMDRLKYNTINKAAKSLENAWGSAAANAATYTGSGTAPYFIKSKNNICNPSLFHRNGQKTLTSSV
jgi:hypothetical protein